MIVHPGNYGPLTAFDSGTGAVKWTAGGDGFFASPIMATLAGTRQIVSATLDSIIGISLDGAALWRYPWEGGGGSITPVLNGDAVLVSALDEGVTALRPTVRDGVWTADPVWRTTTVSMYLSNPVVIHNTLFGLSHRASGQFFALDTATGDVLWVGAPREAANTAVVKAGEWLLLLNDDAELIVARPSRRGFEPVVCRVRIACRTRSRSFWRGPAAGHGTTIGAWRAGGAGSGDTDVPIRGTIADPGDRGGHRRTWQVGPQPGCCSWRRRLAAAVRDRGGATTDEVILLIRRAGRIEDPPWLCRLSSSIRFDSQSVVNCDPELLLASKVALGRLDGDVAEQKLDLIKLAAGKVAETGAGAPQVVRGQLVDPGASRCTADNIP